MSGVTRPRRYFGYHYLLLRFLGLGWWHHPDEGDTRNFPGLYLYYTIIMELVWVVGFVGLETIDPFIGKKDLGRFMFALAFVITHDLTCIKHYLFFSKNVELQEIVHTIEIELHNYYQNNAKIRATIRTSRIITATFIFFGWMTIANADMYGAIVDSHWKAVVAQLNDTSSPIPLRTLPLPMYIPWNYQKDSLYILACALQTVGLLWTGNILLTIDTFIAFLILHMSSQFSIVQEAILTAYDRTMVQLYAGIRQDSDDITELTDDSKELEKRERNVRRHYTEKEIETALDNTLKSCIRQHQILISCVEKFGATYSYGFMTQLVLSTGSICTVMVQLSQDASSLKSMSLMTTLAFFFAMTIQLAMQCYAGNELTFEAGRVADAVMQSKWERMPIAQRRLLLFMMMRAHRPIRLTAAGLIYMDNACFVAIMKTAYSYYAVLSQQQA